MRVILLVQSPTGRPALLCFALYQGCWLYQWSASLCPWLAGSRCVRQTPPQKGGPLLLFLLCFRLSLDSGQAFRGVDPAGQALFLSSCSHLSMITPSSLLLFPPGLEVITALLGGESLGASIFLLNFLYPAYKHVHLLFLTLFFPFFKINFYWSIAALQCCVSFYYITKWISYMFIFIHFLDFLPI